MRHLARVFLMWLGLSGAALLPTAQAAVSSAQVQQVQRLVRAQLDAFAADDAPRAFSYAAASIQQMFGTPEVFLQMVRTSYPVVYRPASVTFLTPKPDGPGIVQPVHMTDAAGASWLALYRLVQLEDKSWRIAGCILAASSAQRI
jgi:hypothetical protein